MKQKLNWKHVAIVLLTISNLILIGMVKGIRQDTINKVYMDQVESGFYNESSTDTMRNPMTGKIETMLIDNHQNGRY